MQHGMCVIVTVQFTDVLAIGAISATRFIDESLVNQLKALGIVAEDAPSAAREVSQTSLESDMIDLLKSPGRL